MGVGRIKTLFSFTVNHMTLSAGKTNRAKNDLAFKYLVDIFCGHVPNEYFSFLGLSNDYLQTTVNLSAPRSVKKYVLVTPSGNHDKLSM